MKKGQTSVTNGVQNLLCPFPELYITQGSNTGSHLGLEAIDVRSNVKGKKAPYYAPCDLKVVRIIATSNTVIWQSLKPVRLANGKVENITIVTAHDNTINFKVGFVVKQGVQMGNMGDAGVGTGVHAHIEQGYGHQISLPATGGTFTLKGKKYPIYGLNNQIPFEEAYFMDDTKILLGKADWVYLKDLPQEKPPVKPKPKKEYIFLKPTAGSWALYPLGVTLVKRNAKATLNPKKFGGLEYEILGRVANGVTIQTKDYGKGNIYIGNDVKKYYEIRKR